MIKIISNIEEFLKYARVSWVVSVDDENRKTDDNFEIKDKSIFIRKIVEAPQDYKELFRENDIDDSILKEIEDIDEIDDKIYVLERAIGSQGVIKLLGKNITTNSKIENVVIEWKEKGLISDYKLISSTHEAMNSYEKIISEWDCSTEERILWLIDRDFSNIGESSEAGLDFIKFITEQNKQENICFMLTAKTDISNEEVRNKLFKQYNILHCINLASVVSKEKFLDIEGNKEELIYEIIEGLWGNYNFLMISQVAKYISEGLKAAIQDFLSLSSSSARNIILNFPKSEGVSVPETIFRVIMTLTSHKFGQAYGDQLENINRLLMDYKQLDSEINEKESKDDKELLFKLRHTEKYDDNVNILRQPIGFGDIFEIENKLYILLSQPCDIAYREKKGRNINEALLVRICKYSKTQDQKGTKHYSEPLKYFRKNEYYWLEFRDFILMDFNILDLCVFTENGDACIPESALEDRKLIQSDILPYDMPRIDDILDYTKEQINEYNILEEVKNKLNSLASEDTKIRPLNNKYKRLVEKKLRKKLKYENGNIIFPVKRITRLKEPFSLKIYSEFANYHSRIGLPGEFITLGEDVFSEQQCDIGLIIAQGETATTVDD